MKAAYGPQVKECMCPKRVNNERNYIQWNFERGSEVFKSAYEIHDVKKSNLKSRQHNYPKGDTAFK
jgi:hypothetical protein